MGRVMLISIRPHFAERIFNGEKNVELRRVRPHVHRGDIAVVYASSPLKALVGAFVIEGVRSMTTSAMWTGHAAGLGVTRDEYTSYFTGARFAHGLLVGDRIRFQAVPLDAARSRVGRFRPPQSYMFWHETLEALLPASALLDLRLLVVSVPQPDETSAAACAFAKG